MKDSPVVAPRNTRIVVEIEITEAERRAWGFLLKALCGSRGWSLQQLAAETDISYDRIKSLAAGKSDLTHAEAEEILGCFSIAFLLVCQGDRQRVEIPRQI